jgi:uncharacterized protein GlcG (DUF336 family)
MRCAKLSAIVLAFVGSATALLPGAAIAEVLTTHRIPAALAVEAVTAAVNHCTAQGFAVTATVIDADAQRIAALRGDTAGQHTYDASWGKAYTAVGFAPLYNLDSSAEVGSRIASFLARQPAGTIPFQPPEHMIFRGGGLTIRFGSEVIGAIGVGGAPTGEADEACARAGLDRIKDRLK